jgi:hypothetical protein
VSEPRLGLASASSGGFEDRVQLLPQASITLTTLVSGNLTTDATVDVWVQVFTGEADTQPANYSCLGSLTLRVRDQLIARPATATPIPFGTTNPFAHRHRTHTHHTHTHTHTHKCGTHRAMPCTQTTERECR